MDVRAQLQATLGDAYTLERELGGGGMSRVFVAEEKALGRKVVVKLLPPELTAGVNVERFNREILVAAKLQHPHIVPVLTAGESNGLPYYTMPFVEGESLRAQLARTGALPVADAVSILRDVAKALAFAHERGIVHRDIKPDNVLLTGGSATVTDFGIAKAISASRARTPGETLTQVGTSIGTPTYMSPEQSAGDPDTDHRTDIYSFGCMAYELLAGRPPFTDKSPVKLLAAHMAQQPEQIAALRPDTPPALAELVMRCLEKDADQRPQHATDLVHVLETVTGGGTQPAMPAVLMGGKGIFQRALLFYAVAFAAVAILAKAAIVGIGLPDWVFPGSLIVMSLGLPVILFTGYAQRVAREAMAVTPMHTPGGTPRATAHGTLATMALKASPHLSWYRTLRGGMWAMAAFVLVIAGFMVLRAMGIGPGGSLLAAGAIKARDRVLLTDFTVSGGDSTLGRVVSDAVRAGLNESTVFTLVSPAEIAAALQRMEHKVTDRLDLPLARQIAQREGIKAIVDGDVAIVGGSYIVAVRLVTADSGKELTSHRATAGGSDKLITAADQVARALRGKAGESLRKVQGAPPLAQFTTSSLEALRKYGEGTRANDGERDFAKAVKALREAVAIDSTFAEAWRKLGVSMNNLGLPRSQSDSAVTRAYRLRDKMSERERDLLVAYYFGSGPGHDRAKSVAAYEALLAAGDSGQALNNLALQLDSRREFARAETLLRANVRLSPGSQLAFTNLIANVVRQGRLDTADSLIAAAGARFSGAPTVRQLAIGSLANRGRVDAFEHAVDSMVKTKNQRDPAQPLRAAASVAILRGRLKAWRTLSAQAFAADSSLGRNPPAVFAALSQLAVISGSRLPFDAELRALDAALARSPIEKLPESERPYFALANTLAQAHKPERARAVLAQYQASVRDTALRRWNENDVHGVQANIAVAEHRWSDAIDESRKAERQPDGPSNSCQFCLSTTLVYIYSEAGMADSAIAEYERYRKSAWGSRPLDGADLTIGAQGYELMAKLYEAKGDAAKAAEHYRVFIDLWKNADPELQPRVAEARSRLAKLTPVEKPRH